MTGKSLQRDHIGSPVCRLNCREFFSAVHLQELKGLRRGTSVCLLKVMMSGVQKLWFRTIFMALHMAVEVGCFLFEVVISHRTEKFSVKFFFFFLFFNGNGHSFYVTDL